MTTMTFRNRNNKRVTVTGVDNAECIKKAARKLLCLKGVRSTNIGFWGENSTCYSINQNIRGVTHSCGVIYKC